MTGPGGVPPSPRILAIDDDAAYHGIARAALESRGMTCRTAANGAAGLLAARDWNPDVVLLDYNMPDMNGAEVLKRLRAGQGSAFLPVIMLTSESAVERKAETLNMGADDYLTKPFSPVELIVRVQVQVRAKRLNDELQRANAKLREMEAFRENLTRFIVHDLKNIAAAMRLGLSMGIERCAANPAADPELRMILDRSANSAKRMLSMTEDLLDVGRLEEGRLALDMRPCEIEDILAECRGQMGLLAESAKARLIVEPPPGPGRVLADRALLLRVMVNLVGNAIKFSKAGDRRVELIARPDPSRTQWTFSVQDNGPGIAREHLERVFDKFFRIKAQQDTLLPGTGLGLAFCRLAVEAQGGRIRAESEIGKGSRFSFELKAAA